ncbi:MAG: hypothetical protein PHT91_01780 [Candidatus Nanoarchaeia archaeon]|nr:hypothetical protein [Candidatus Nanoarchaeia archaeon]MDD5499585.1 hypothetical protein [Candidatus Nanoarchaeia archaeon]
MISFYFSREKSITKESFETLMGYWLEENLEDEEDFDDETQESYGNINFFKPAVYSDKSQAAIEMPSFCELY